MKLMRRLLLLLAIAGCATDSDDAPTTSTEATSTRTFSAAADARVEQGHPSSNYGTSSRLSIDTSPMARSYLRFEVSGIGSAAVQSARLRLRASNGTTNGPGVFFTAGAWSEGAVTWSNQPGPSGAAITDLGVVARDAWFEIDLSSVVTGDGSYDLVLVPASSDGLEVGSRESSNPPQLVVTLDSGGSDPPPPPPPPTSGATYYVDSASGNDGADGRSTATAWRTLSRANAAPLLPGDQLLFRRGGVWPGGLDITRSGTATAPIAIGAYGTGERPVFRGGTSSCVRASGSYLQLSEIWADDCTWAGFDVAGTHVVIEASTTSHNAAGVDIRQSAADGAVRRCTVRDNTRMSVLTQGGDDDSGAFGVVLHGDRTEVAWNSISGQDAFSYDYGRDGSAVEVYGGIGNHVHHNDTWGNDAFTELGNSRSRDNTFAYNAVRGSNEKSIFLVTRGAGSSWGPVLGTRAYNNSVYLTGASSQGFVCHAGCGPDILVMRNNIIEAVWKSGYADAPFDEDYDLFYQGQRQFTMGPHSAVADPRFVSPGTGDLHLQAGSPAIDRGVSLGYSQDLDGAAVPRDGDGNGSAAPDLGAYER